MLPAVEIAHRSDPGRDPEKQVNEDACGQRETAHGHLTVVCDGMGGHAGGREAANLALETVFEVFAAAAADARPFDVLRDALVAANKRVFAMDPIDEGGRRGRPEAHMRPGSTIVAALVHAGGAEVAHVGDSRCYLVHGSQIFQVTKDHSMVQELVDARFLTPAQAAVHPNANQITRALGMLPKVDVDVRPQPLHLVAGDALVLCSDGLSDLVESPEILQIVGSAPAAQAAGQLVDLANARGGHDNVTVAIVRAREATAAQPTAVLPTLAQTQATDPSLLSTLPAGGVRVTVPDGGPPTVREIPAADPVGSVAPPAATAAPAAPPVVAPGLVLRVGAPPPPRDEPPSSRGSTPPRRGMPASIMLGLALAGIAILILIAILYMHFAEHEKRHHAAFPLNDAPDAGDASAPDGAAP